MGWVGNDHSHRVCSHPLGNRNCPYWPPSPGLRTVRLMNPDSDRIDRELSKGIDSDGPPTQPDPGAVVNPFGLYAALAVLVAFGVVIGFLRPSPQSVPLADPAQVLVAPSAAEVAGNGVGSAAAARDALWSPYGGSILFEPGLALENVTGTADGWVFDQPVEREKVLRVLRSLTALDTAGRDEYGQISVSGPDGSSLWVSDDALGSFGAYVTSRSPWECSAALPGQAPSGGVGAASPGKVATAGTSRAPDGPPVAGAVETSPVLPVQPVCVTADLPSTTDARATAIESFRALGLEVGGTRVTTRSDGASVNVTAEVMLDGVPSNMFWSAEVSGKGLFSLYGFTASPRRISSYPVIGASSAVSRANDPRYKQYGPLFLGPWDVMPMPAQARDASISSSETSTMPSMPGAPATQEGSSSEVREIQGRPVFTVILEKVKITSGQLGLSQFVLADGRIVLFPVWLLEAADGRRWSMLALDESHLEFRSPETIR